VEKWEILLTVREAPPELREKGVTVLLQMTAWDKEKDQYLLPEHIIETIQEAYDFVTHPEFSARWVEMVLDGKSKRLFEGETL